MNYVGKWIWEENWGKWIWEENWHWFTNKLCRFGLLVKGRVWFRSCFRMFGDTEDKDFVKMGSGWFIPDETCFGRKSMDLKLVEKRIKLSSICIVGVQRLGLDCSILWKWCYQRKIKLNVALKWLNGALAKCRTSIATNNFESGDGYVLYHDITKIIWGKN